MRGVCTGVLDAPPEAVWALLQAPETHIAIARPYLALSPGDGHARFAELLHDGPTSFRLKLFGLVPLGTRIWEISRPVNQPGQRQYAMMIETRAPGLTLRRVLSLSQHHSGRSQLTETMSLSGWRARLHWPFGWLAQRARMARVRRVVAKI